MAACTFTPKQILKKEVSQKEYEFLQEWAPDTIKDYTPIKPGNPVDRMPKHQTMPSQPHVQSPRRAKPRSPLYEEWKVQPLHRETLNEAAKATGASVSMENKTNGMIPPAPTTNVRVNGRRPSNSLDTNIRQQEPVKSSPVLHNHYAKPTASTNNRVIANPVPSVATKSGVPRPGPYKPVEQNNKRVMVSQRRLPPPPYVYTAPNRKQFRNDDLIRWSDGIKTLSGAMAYFQPSFIQDPWKDMKPVVAKFLERYW
ncbi:hypothetical protein BO79DRAFT_233268 [Aspergillus costaricaensis CBS 115574]|uniref:Uncharacterized protein n=1 Tax=Aspergillus costaricaensis CBS 115574 TaxID=1448317 RepID=A0ACD1I174_9EURO|nr:hypothetical protein BO79DRAFT_233268 [Aspergillus costaricaensis CBS 115574]RAK83516.1 hypothetical protein BO79DRAFT_233268 [Aspergillus costaricaensis CBS 115574]